MERVRYNFFKTPEQLTEQAKEGLLGNKGSSLIVNFVYFLSKIMFFAGLSILIYAFVIFNSTALNKSLFFGLGLGFLFVSMLTYGPLRVGVCKNALNMVNNTNPKAKDVWYGFKNKYFRNVWFGICLFFVYLFSLILLVFPFVIKHVSYQVAGFILAEDNEISAIKALKLSSKMSKGYRKTYIKVFFKFVPQMLLCIITAYIYSLWLRPKFNAVVACYYLDIKS